MTLNDTFLNKMIIANRHKNSTHEYVATAQPISAYLNGHPPINIVSNGKWIKLVAI